MEYGCFQKSMVPPNHPILIGFSIIFTNHFGGKHPIFGSTSICSLEENPIFHEKKHAADVACTEVYSCSLGQKDSLLACAAGNKAWATSCWYMLPFGNWFRNPAKQLGMAKYPCYTPEVEHFLRGDFC